jgi:hypothetical protein
MFTPSSSLLKKRTKKLLLVWGWGCATTETQIYQKFFATFFQKSSASFRTIIGVGPA